MSHHRLLPQDFIQWTVVCVLNISFLCDFQKQILLSATLPRSKALNAETKFIGLSLNCLHPDITNLSGNNRWNNKRLVGLTL